MVYTILPHKCGDSGTTGSSPAGPMRNARMTGLPPNCGSNLRRLVAMQLDQIESKFIENLAYRLGGVSTKTPTLTIPAGSTARIARACSSVTCRGLLRIEIQAHGIRARRGRPLGRPPRR